MEVAYARMLSRQRRPAAGRGGVPRRARRALDVPVRPRSHVQLERSGCARRPTPSTTRTCPRCSRCSPTCASTAPTTATGSGAGRRSRSCAGDLRAISRAIRARLGGADAVSWCWLALVDVRAGRRDARRRPRPRDGAPAGLARRVAARAPSRYRGALRADARVVDPAGAPRAGLARARRRRACGCRSTTSRSSRRGARVLADARRSTRSRRCCATPRTSRARSPSRAAPTRGALARRPVRAHVPGAASCASSAGVLGRVRRRPGRRSSATAAPGPGRPAASPADDRPAHRGERPGEGCQGFRKDFEGDFAQR